MKCSFLCAIALAVTTSVGAASNAAEQKAPDSRTERGQEQRGTRLGIAIDKDYLPADSDVAPSPRRLEESPTACALEASKNAAQATVDEYTLKTVFTCGDNTEKADLKPDLSSNAGKCFQTSDCTPNTYKDVDGMVSFAGGKFTLQLNKMPARTDQLFYKCEKGNKSCVLTVKMPTEPSPNECTLSKTVQLEIADEKSSVEFICKSTAEAGVQLLPLPETASVYQGFDCKTEKALKELLPDAKLEGSARTKYTLSVTTLPRERLELCYKCNYKNTEAADKPCLVKVTVEPATTTTTTQTTSSASFARRFSYFVAGAALTAGAFGAC